jgi:ATP adenylyltransferase
VATVSDDHLALLNKFNVIDRHLLIVTRCFEDQERLLTQADFSALWRCLLEFDGLGFYNGGEIAGASQPHKHLQLIPLPLAAGISGTPMDVIWAKQDAGGELLHLPGLPFRHVFMRLAEPAPDKIEALADQSLTTYQQMLQRVGIATLTREGMTYQSAPYNLLMTRRWMLLVPRKQEAYEGISINALGFAGSLFVPRPADLDGVRRQGPMNILKAVSFED